MACDLKALNHELSTKSYIVGFQPTHADLRVLKTIQGDASAFPHVMRWMNHILSFSPAEQASWPREEAPAATATAPAKAAEDDLDLFGESETAEEKEAREEREFEARAKAAQARIDARKAAAGKVPEVQKSMLVLDVKPWDDETDLKEMERRILEIQMPGLTWGKAEAKEIAYGMKKLCIGCVIEDDRVSTDLLEERVTAIEDLVQSMDIASFNKL